MPPPLRFVAMVLTLWIGSRAAMMLPGAPEAMAPAPAALRLLLGVPAVAAVPDGRGRGHRAVSRRLPPVVAVALPSPRPAATAIPALPVSAAAAAKGWTFSPADRALLVAYMGPRGRLGAPRAPSPGFEAAMAAGAPPSRWSGDAFLFVRGEDGGGIGLAPGAQLGGGQAFARLVHRLDDAGRLAATARLSRALGVRQTEGAIGVRRRVAPGVTATVERRVALDEGGRSAWAAFVAGGLDGRAVGPVVVDGYAQAGVVGARRRDGFVDGAVRAGRPAGPARLGVGLWGAAQPGAARLDVGPQAVARLPAGLAVAVDWRLRVAGRARPGSGVALTIAAGF